MSSETYLLLHGAWHNANCWQKVLPLLKQQKISARALDLPGHGADKTPAKSIHLTTYIDFVCESIVSSGTPVVLVGHSFAGIILSAVISRIPGWIKRAVYITAFVPKPQQSLLRIAEGWETSPLPTVVDPLQGWMRLKPEAINLLYANAKPEEFADIQHLLQPEPLQPMMEPVSLLSDPYSAVPCHYIAARQDCVISLANQLAMVERVIDKITVLDSDHSPFYTQPEQLVRALVA